MPLVRYLNPRDLSQDLSENLGIDPFLKEEVSKRVSRATEQVANDLKKKEYEDFQAELDSANNRFETVLAAGRPPWQSQTDFEDEMRRRILDPVHEKWLMNPVTSGSVQGHVAALKFQQDTREAARQLQAQKSYQTRYGELIAQKMTPQQAAMTAALENPELVFRGRASALASNARPPAPAATRWFPTVVQPNDPRGYAEGPAVIGENGAFLHLAAPAPLKQTAATGNARLRLIESQIKAIESGTFGFDIERGLPPEDPALRAGYEAAKARHERLLQERDALEGGGGGFTPAKTSGLKVLSISRE